MGWLAKLAACAPPNQEIQFIPSKKSAAELRVAQTRLMPGSAETVVRDVIATLHDLGYRLTKAEPGAGTVSGTRQTALRMAVVVQPRSAQESVVRANATIVALRQEAQVDSAEFYQNNFFVPLQMLSRRDLLALPDDVTTPDPVRPATEFNTIKQREGASGRPAPTAAATQPPGTNTK